MKRELPSDRLELLRPEDHRGLTDSEAAAWRARYGSNRIAEHAAKSAREIVGDTAKDPMLWFLAVTSLLFALLRQFTDALVLLLAIAPLVGIDFYLHRRTEASVAGLRGVLATQARVIRQGRERCVDAAELVAGDLVQIRASESFPADGVILAGGTLQADESSLTGEAYPVPKNPLESGSTGGVPEKSWAFAGTRLLTGEALMRVIFTGNDTIYGEIVQAATTSRHQLTPLQLAVNGLVRSLLFLAGGACLLLAAVRLAQGYGPIDAFLSAAVLAVAAIPEEFPVVLTFFLGLGVYRLARRHALVRQATAVENIGRVSAICSDKTGTITRGRLALHELRPASGSTPERLLDLARAASRPEAHDPLDEALLEGAVAPAGRKLLRSFPFTEAKRREVAVWEENGKLSAVSKGAPETILDLCELNQAEKRRIGAEVAAMANQGQKVIACASRTVDNHAVEPADKFSYEGLIGISDPLRPGVRNAVRSTRDAGIRLVMVTGDHPHTAAAIAREAGFGAQPKVITGDDLVQRLDHGGPATLDEVDVVARATPSQKVALVQAMRENGRITAVTGDGVNDVPALKVADVGIAMGQRGTRSAREVAAIILLDDDFATIVRAIAEGRQLFRNLARSFAFLLMVHIPLVSTAAVIPLLGYPLLYLPIHVVILELLIHPFAILGFQQVAQDRLARENLRGGAFFQRKQAAVIGITGTVLTFAIAMLFIAATVSGQSAEYARTVAMVTLIAGTVSIFTILTRLDNTAAKLLAGSAVLLAVLITTVPPLSAAAHLDILGPGAWLLTAAAGALAVSPAWFFRDSADEVQPTPAAST